MFMDRLQLHDSVGDPREGGSEDIDVPVLLNSLVLIHPHLSHLGAAENHTGHISIVWLNVHAPARQAQHMCA